MERSNQSMASASELAGSEDDIYTHSHASSREPHMQSHTSLRPSIENTSADRRSVDIAMASSIEHEHQHSHDHEHCDKKHDPYDADIAIMSDNKLAGKTVAPFLAKHIPEQYAPMGGNLSTADSKRDPNTKFCYRHRPDSKCRRTADEPTMEILQKVCCTCLVIRALC